MIEGIRRIQDMMERQSYITDRAVATTTYLASELRKPVLMDTAKARRELRWRARHDGHETLAQTIEAAREAGIV